jgi:hypothetical protein
MGIAIDYFNYVAELAHNHRIPTRSCLQLGKQDIQFDFETLIAVATRFGFLRMNNGKLMIPPDHPLMAVVDSDNVLRDPSRRSTGYVSDLAAFAALGFARVDSLDVNDHEGASVIWNLNEPGLGSALQTTYDLILDGGTLEHIFHLPHALENVIDALSIGGYVLHASPMNNYVDHGFYQFSPTFFFDFYLTNGFEIVDATIFESDETNSRPVFLRRYERGAAALAEFPYVGSLDGRLYTFLFAARKTAKSTSNRTPEQFLYAGRSLAGHPALADAEKVIVWGAGAAARTIIARRFDLARIDFFIDADVQRQAETCLGLPVRAPEALLHEHDCVVVVSSAKYENTIRLQISQQYGDHVRRIVTLDELLREPWTAAAP